MSPVLRYHGIAAAEKLAPGWQAEGACHTPGVDPGWFFPAQGESDLVARAKTVCRECPVRAECLEYALTAGEHYGVWGGKSEAQRKRLRSERVRARRGAA